MASPETIDGYINEVWGKLPPLDPEVEKISRVKFLALAGIAALALLWSDQVKSTTIQSIDTKAEVKEDKPDSERILLQLGNYHGKVPYRIGN